MKDDMRWRPAALAFAVAGSLVLAACGGSEDSDSGGDGDGGGESQDGALTTRWEGEPAAYDDSGLVTMALWATDTTVTEITNDTVRSIDAASGETRWELTPPSGAGEVCAIAPELNDQGVGALVYSVGDSDTCTLLSVVDTTAATGEPLFTQDVTPEDGLSSFVGVSVTGDTVTVTPGGTDLFRYSVAGDELPAPEMPDAAECQDRVNWTVGGDYLVGDVQCDIMTEVYQLTAFDAAEGTELWTLPERPEEWDGVAEIVPGDLLTVRTSTVEDRLLTFDEAGEVLSEVLEVQDGSEVELTLYGPNYSTIRGSLLHAAGGLGDSSERVGIDLNTGAVAWQQTFPESTTIGGDAERTMVVYQDEEYVLRAASLSPEDGAPTELGALPDFEGEPYTSPEALVARGDTLYVLFMLSDTVTGETTATTAAYQLSE
ncbi:PQQ-binding-like beta-propeller repeat protein [Streptomyces hainanensis]|uniref:PQQ-binding-like beta-propeller repeat protein n=1 Tax=Streptomyces hainanensis TaxID=402648 RepID=A0A4R4SN90_9ACTN|nr:PQQ-binding-like beta-propeller repeat protein [Streptomyces hainanensis]TDC65287.1 hypothetical protein E1283_30720 [Streptomyces hainanensis]